MKTLAIIPARGGSKRFPGKNIHLLNGIPLIVYSIKYAQFHGASTIVVSTDDDTIADISRAFGAEVINRPPALSVDTSTTLDAVYHALLDLENNGNNFDLVITLQPTNPLRPKHLWQDALNKFSLHPDSVMSVSLNHLKLGKLSEEGLFIPETYQPGQRTQDLDQLYFENGLFYLTTPELIKQKQLFGKNVQTVITLNQFSVDIDYMHDLMFAESLIKSNITEYTYFI